MADVHIAVVTTYALTVETLADIADLAVHQAIAQVALVAVAVAVEAEASAAAVPEVAAAEEAAVGVAWADAVEMKH